MAVDLKTFYDKAQQARSERTLIENELSTLLADGTEESYQKALDKRPELDKANSRVEEADALYNAMCASAKDAGAAPAMFVPVPTTPADGEKDAKNEMKRDEFTALDAAKRLEFVKGGGKVID